MVRMPGRGQRWRWRVIVAAGLTVLIAGCTALLFPERVGLGDEPMTVGGALAGVGQLMLCVAIGVALFIFLLPGLAPATVGLVWLLGPIPQYLARWRLRLIGVSADGTVYGIHRDAGARGDSAEVRLPGLAMPIMVRLVTPLGVGDSIRVRYERRRPDRARHVDWSARGLIRSIVEELVALAMLAGLGYLGFLLLRGPA